MVRVTGRDGKWNGVGSRVKEVEEDVNTSEQNFFSTSCSL